MSSRMPSNMNINNVQMNSNSQMMSYSMPSMVPQWPPVWNQMIYSQRHPNSAQNGFGFYGGQQLRPQSQAFVGHQQQSQQNMAFGQSMTYPSHDNLNTMNTMPFNSWNNLNAMQLMRPQIISNSSPYLPQTNNNETQIFNQLNTATNSSVVSSLQRFSNCDNNHNSKTPPKKSFEVSSHSSRSSSYSSHKCSFQTNQRSDKNTKRDNSYHRFRNKEFNTSSKNKSKYQRSPKTHHSESLNNNNTITDTNTKSDVLNEPDFKKRKTINKTKSFEENNSITEDNNEKPNALKKESVTKVCLKKDQSFDAEEIYTKPVEWLRCSPAELFYETKRDNSEWINATKRMIELRDKFRDEILLRAERAKQLKPAFQFPARTVKLKPPKTLGNFCFLISF